jgi:hypothetical protein
MILVRSSWVLKVAVSESGAPPKIVLTILMVG